MERDNQTKFDLREPQSSEKLLLSSRNTLDTSANYIEVCIPPLEQRFTYRLTTTLIASNYIGWLIEAPFGKQHRKGFIVGAPTDTSIANEKLKVIDEKHCIASVFCPKQLAFFSWVARYYAVPLSRVLETASPRVIPPKKARHVMLLRDPGESVRGKTIQAVCELLKRTPSGMPMSLLKRHIPTCGSSVRTLKERGVVEEFETFAQPELGYGIEPEGAFEALTLTTEQEQTVEKIVDGVAQSRFEVHLVHGETGSGKTEVYIEAARFAARQGRGVLVLVPEISLTPQLLDRFERRLGQKVAVLHSGVTPRQRWDDWTALRTGQASIVIGARSAVFAPVQDLGLIVVDEEHDSSFKQSDNLRYSARELALVLARMNSCPIVLGSATPSLEAFYASEQKRYMLHRLQSYQPQRNRFHIVDMSIIKRRDLASPSLSQPFVSLLQQHLDAGSQAFILLNRRGFASYLHCEKCQHVVTCPNCSVTSTYYARRKTLLCHYCGHHQPPPLACPACHESNCLKELGTGTERLEVELSELMPNAKVERLDRDNCSTLKEYEALLSRLRAREIDVLVGTQMIAKGHDLPCVQFVGVVDCDIGVHFPDFRAAEKSFQLLTQVSGRAGRFSEAGDVVLQTRLPKHPSITCTRDGDYVGFARQELRVRRQLLYPPFSFLLRVIAATESQSRSESILKAVAEFVSRNWSQKDGVILLGPVQCPIEKIKTRWRSHILIKCQKLPLLLEIQNRLRAIQTTQSDRVLFDLNPIDLL